MAISDGVNSQTSSFDVNVVGEGTEEEGDMIVLIGLLVAVSFAVIIAVAYLVLVMKRE